MRTSHVVFGLRHLVTLLGTNINDRDLICKRLNTEFSKNSLTTYLSTSLPIIIRTAK